MAENKKSVVMYCDIIHTVENLEDNEAGKLFKHYLRYINDLNPESDRFTEIIFEPIKQQLKRDLKKFEATCEKNKKNVEIRWNKINTKNTSGKKGKNKLPLNTIHTDNDNDNDNDIKYYRTIKHLKISFEENGKLLQIGYDQKQIDSIYDSIENFKANTKYVSLYLTALKWLKNEYPIIEQKQNKYTEDQIKIAKNYWSMDRILPDFFDKNDIELLK